MYICAMSFEKLQLMFQSYLLVLNECIEILIKNIIKYNILVQLKKITADILQFYLDYICFNFVLFLE